MPLCPRNILRSEAAIACRLSDEFDKLAWILQNENYFLRLRKTKEKKMKTSAVAWVCMGLVSYISADGQFVSRPDLSPPRLNITIPATEDVGDGHIFVCPYGGFKSGTGFDGPEQPACYIFRDDGDLVWSSLGHLSGWAANIQARSFRGKPAITVYQGAIDGFRGHGWGQATILNERYENVATIRAGNHKIMSIHEFNLLQSNSALVEIYQPTPIDLTRFNGQKGAKWIVDAIFQGKLSMETENFSKELRKY